MKIPTRLLNVFNKTQISTPVAKMGFAELLNTTAQQYQVIQQEPQKTDNPSAQPDPWVGFKRQLPHLAKQVLGQRYAMVSNVTSRFISPERAENIADRLFEQVSQVAQRVSQTRAIQQRRTALPVSPNSKQAIAAVRALSKSVELENKVIATTEGAVMGMAGVVGAVVDLPVMIVLALRTIYQTAACYGVDLESDEGLAVALDILSDVDLGVFAQKQVILLAISQAKLMMQDADLKAFYDWAGQNTDAEKLRQFITRIESKISDRFKPKHIVLNYISPVAAASVAGFYNGLVIAKVAEQARKHFSGEVQK